MPQSFDQTTDPLAADNEVTDEDSQWGPMVAGIIAEDSLGDLVRDPGKGDTGGAPTWKGSQASDFM